MNGTRRGLLVCAAVVWCLSSAVLGNVIIETVPVGIPGNPGDTRYSGGGVPSFGGVGYTYNIGKYEVTTGQYAEFLNTVAKTDTYGLYTERMDCDYPSLRGCYIKRTGSPGSHTYKPGDGSPADMANWGNRLVNLVSWGDAGRFAEP
jgi:formylglycine-generating enzyme